MGIVRLFLALVVVTAHFQSSITRPNDLPSASEKFMLGFHSAYAVLFFYVISGFLITFTLSRNYVGQPGGTAKFYTNRMIRIFSLYWPVVIFAFLTMPGSLHGFLTGSVLNQFTQLFLLGADWNLDFGSFPADNVSAVPEGLHPAWTLGAEMSFYLLAPMLIRDWRAVLGLFAASLFLRTLLVSNLGTHIVERWTYYFAPSTFLFFLAGQGACLLSRRFQALKSHRLGYAAMAAAFLIMFFTHDRGFDIPRLWFSIACFTIGLPGFFDATKNLRWMNTLGNLSYPVYLTHQMAVYLAGPPLFYWFLAHGLAGPNHVQLLIVSFLVVVVAVAFVAHIAVEQPVSHAMKAGLAQLRRAVSRERTRATGGHAGTPVDDAGGAALLGVNLNRGVAS